MPLEIKKAGRKEILYLRNLYLQENNFQIRYNAVHERGWADSYFILHKKEKIGYGCLHGNSRDTVFEFYIIPSFRSMERDAFRQFIHSSQAVAIECQSNDLLLSSLLYEFGQNIQSDTILFEEGFTSDIKPGDAVFRKRTRGDVIFEHKAEPVGDFVLELNNEVVATGGFLLHYNMPFADLYMEVKEEYRRKGLGSLLIQEVKKQCYLAGRVPAARTGINNIASKATLLRAGFKIAGYMLLGGIKS